ncbi:MAG: GDSL family lipase [Saprospiraceae bacterium]|nr:GDSL family lipase [Saprospiraceae bacterium]
MKNFYFLLFSFLLIAMAFRAPEPKVRIFLIGDSTMADKPLEENPERGWGQLLPTYFTESVEIHNHAKNGRSTKSFRDEGLWEEVEKQLKPGDWVFIQFGHNDSKIEDPKRYAAPQTDYHKNLIRYIQEARAKGAKPLLLTPVMRRSFDENGNFKDTHGEYPDVVREVAAKENVPLIDVHKSTESLIVNHGVEGSKKLSLWFTKGYYEKLPEGKEDNTHFSDYGARQVAALVMDSIRSLKLDLVNYFKPSPFPEKYAYELPNILQPVFKKDTFNIINFGAIADGITKNTEFINKAINECNNSGGGVVIIPKGLWLTGPIVLKSNVNLHLQAGALLQFSDQREDYPLVESTFEGLAAYRNQAPISAKDAENIAITGKGIIDGAGGVWRPVKKSKLTDSQWKKLVASGGVLDAKGDIWYPSESAIKGSMTENPGVMTPGKTLQDNEAIKDFLRPNMITFTNCKQILLQDVIFQNSPAWCLHPLLSEHITLRNLIVKNPAYAQNGDGLDLESCKNVIVEGCHFDVGDDAICLKSGKNEFGRKRGIATENIIIRNNAVYAAHGGIVIGSEMSGGVRNVFASDCTFMGTDIGLRFKTTRGRGGIVENIYISDINMTNIPAEAILFDMYYNGKEAAEALKNLQADLKPVTEETPVFRKFYIRNITCKGAEHGIYIQGLPEMNVQDILIENAVFEVNQGFTCIEGDDIQLKNITFLSKDNQEVIKIINGKNITLDHIQYPDNIESFFNIIGQRSKNITIKNTKFKDNKKQIQLGEGLNSSILKLLK